MRGRTLKRAATAAAGMLAVMGGIPGGVMAQAGADTTVGLPGITVTATREATNTADVPVRVTVLEARTMEATGARSVADMLETRAGAFVRRYGPGGLASLSLRGTGAAQTLILLDGQRLTDPQLGQLDLSLLPTVLLASVDVLHGAGSALYGSAALGGVVNLHTLRPGSGPSVRLSGTYGAYGERRTGLVLAGNSGSFSGLVAAEYHTAEGDFPYLNASLFPPREVRREGADEQRTALYATLGYRTGRHHATLGAWHNDARRGLPGPSTAVPRGERQWDTHLRVWAADRVNLRRGMLRLAALVQEGSLRYANPQLRLDETGRTRTASLEAEATHAAGPHWMLGGGLASSYGRARHPSLSEDAAERHLGLFTHATADYGHLRLYPALRLDTYRATDAPARMALSPRLGVNVRPLAALRLKASLGRAFRAPTFNDRFWQPGGNADLRAEHGWTYDAGLLVRHRWWAEAELTAFAHRIRDQIVWLPEGGVWSPTNFSRVRSRGVEASGTVRLPRPVRLEAGFFYTYTDARDRSDATARSYDQPLRYVPRHQLKAFIDGAWRLLSLNLAAHYTGRRHITTDASQWLDAFWSLSAGFGLQGPAGPAHLTLSAHLDNLLDAAYEGIKGYPMPPRTLRLRLLVEVGRPSL